MSEKPRLSALLIIHNEEKELADCLDCLTFAGEIVIVLDKCTDKSKEIAFRYTDRILEGSWDKDGERRNIGIGFCRGEWILEVDADERIPEPLAREIEDVIAKGEGDIFDIRAENYIGGKKIVYGVGGGGFVKFLYPGLFRKGAKTWGSQWAHPDLYLTGNKGGCLQNPMIHLQDHDISAMLRRLDRNSTWRAKDLCESGELGSFPNMVRKFFSRFFKCYVIRKGYKEREYGLVMALCSGLYPLLSHLKAALEEAPRRALSRQAEREPQT